ncbi:MAG: NFACT family protein [Betaproteobacteria bacterium]
MHFDILSSVVNELAALLGGARVDRVLQGKDDGVLYLLFRKNRKDLTLLLSCDRSLPRMHLVNRKPRSASEPHPLVLILRSRLVGARVVHVGLLNQDRIVEIRIAEGPREYRLIFELTGSSSNLFFTDGELRILSLYFPVPASEHAQRSLLPGTRYTLPQKKMRPAASKRVPLDDASRTPNRSAELYYEHLVDQQRVAALKAGVRSSVTKALARAERRRVALCADLQAVQEAEEYRRQGDLVLANLQHLKTGMKYVEITGYDGIPIPVQLDPKRTPSQNAELYFKKYKKAKAAFPLIRRRLHDVQEEVSYLRTLLIDLEHATDTDALGSMQSELQDRGYVKQGAGARRKTVREPASGIRTILVQGWEILVGRSAAGNDYLTTKLARPDDLWLHAEGLPGSHVLVRNPKKSDIPSHILIKAASLAAWNSKGKAADTVPVTYTRARFVRKPKGAKPGLVVLSQRKTLMVKPSDDSSR